MPHTTPKRPTSHAGGSLQRFLRERGRMVHKSCDARMIQHPANPNAPWIPWVSKPGNTLKLGRNKLKRKVRGLQALRRAAAVGNIRAEKLEAAFAALEQQ